MESGSGVVSCRQRQRRIERATSFPFLRHNHSAGTVATLISSLAVDPAQLNLVHCLCQRDHRGNWSQRPKRTCRVLLVSWLPGAPGKRWLVTTYLTRSNNNTQHYHEHCHGVCDDVTMNRECGALDGELEGRAACCSMEGETAPP